MRFVIAAMTTIALNLAAAAKATVFEPETFALDNGLEVVVVSNHRAPVVAHWLWYKVGSADSPWGQSGIAHFLEHLMFKGTESLAAGEFSKIVARNGGNDNAMTGQDFTAYFQVIARDRLELVMGMEADRMANLKLDTEHVASERDVVLEERRLRVDNEPSAIFQEQLNASQFLHHPYRFPVIGWFSEMEAYSREKALDFYKQWYAPNNAILVVAGDITADELRPIAERTYGKVASKTVPERSRVAEPPQSVERRMELASSRVQQPTLVRSYLAPSFNSDDGGHAYALEVLSELFGSGSTSRLYVSLVIEQSLAAGAGSAYRGTSLDQSVFRLYASPRPDVDMDALEAALDAEIETLLRDGVKQDELDRVKGRMVAEAIYARDSLSGAARAFGAALTTGLTIEDVESWPSRIAAVTVEEVMAAARLVIDDKRAVTGRLIPGDA